MTDTVENTPVESTQDDSQAVAEMVNESTAQEQAETPEWLQSKYIVDGKSQEESIAEQAKAYTELSSKFGAFTGAPESYELAVSEELAEMGVEFKSDDPMVEAAIQFAKDSNMSQDGLNGMLNLYAQQQVAEQKANEEYRATQLDALGPNATARVENISQWASKNLDPETVAGLEGMATSAESVKAIERLISMTRGQPVNPSDANNNSGSSAEDVRAMQFEKDGNGNRRINTDPEFKARYHKLRNEVYGTEDHRVVIGG